MRLLTEKNAPLRLTAEQHPENQPAEPEEFPAGDIKPRPASFGRALLGMWLGGAVGSLLTLMTVAMPLGAGDAIAALSMLPLMITLIAVVNGWIAANLFLDSGIDRPSQR